MGFSRRPGEVVECLFSYYQMYSFQQPSNQHWEIYVDSSGRKDIGETT